MSDNTPRAGCAYRRLFTEVAAQPESQPGSELILIERMRLSIEALASQLIWMRRSGPLISLAGGVEPWWVIP